MAKETKQFHAGLLRNGTAVVYRLLKPEERIGAWLYMGWSDDMPDHHYEMWKNTGHWADDSSTHALDLVSDLGVIYQPIGA